MKTKVVKRSNQYPKVNPRIDKGLIKKQNSESKNSKASSVSYKSKHGIGRRSSSNNTTYTQNCHLFFDLYSKDNKSIQSTSVNHLDKSIVTGREKFEKQNDSSQMMSLKYNRRRKSAREAGLNASAKLSAILEPSKPTPSQSSSTNHKKGLKLRSQQISLQRKLKRELGLETPPDNCPRQKRMASLNASAIINAFSTTESKRSKTIEVDTSSPSSTATIPCTDRTYLESHVKILSVDQSSISDKQGTPNSVTTTECLSTDTNLNHRSTFESHANIQNQPVTNLSDTRQLKPVTILPVSTAPKCPALLPSPPIVVRSLPPNQSNIAPSSSAITSNVNNRFIPQYPPITPNPIGQSPIIVLPDTFRPPPWTPRFMNFLPAPLPPYFNSSPYCNLYPVASQSPQPNGFQLSNQSMNSNFTPFYQYPWLTVTPFNSPISPVSIPNTLNSVQNRLSTVACTSSQSPGSLNNRVFTPKDLPIISSVSNSSAQRSKVNKLTSVRLPKSNSKRMNCTSTPSQLKSNKPRASLTNQSLPNRIIDRRVGNVSRSPKKVVQKPITKGDSWEWVSDAKMKPVFTTSDSPPTNHLCYQSAKHTRDGMVVKENDNVLLCSGANRLDPPHVARITALYENEKGVKTMSLLWYYRPEHVEIRSSSNGGGGASNVDKTSAKNRLFASRHCDLNPVECIEDKALVLSRSAYNRLLAQLSSRRSRSANDRQPSVLKPSATESYDYLIRLLNMPEDIKDLDSRNSTASEPVQIPPNLFYCDAIYDVKTRKITHATFPFSPSSHSDNTGGGGRSSNSIGASPSKKASSNIPVTPPRPITTYNPNTWSSTPTQSRPSTEDDLVDGEPAPPQLLSSSEANPVLNGGQDDPQPPASSNESPLLVPTNDCVMMEADLSSSTATGANVSVNWGQHGEQIALSLGSMVDSSNTNHNKQLSASNNHKQSSVIVDDSSLVSL